MNLEVTETRLQNVTMTGMSNLETIKALGGERHFFAQWERTYAQSLNARVTTITHNIYLSASPFSSCHVLTMLMLLNVSRTQSL